MSAAFKARMEAALEVAVEKQFCTLFTVLCVVTDEKAYKAFNLGLEKLAATEQAVGVIIAELE